MVISELRIHPVAAADPPLRSSYGLHAPYALRTILELKTTDGLTGISETYGGDEQIATYELLRSRIEGMDPFQLTSLWRDLTSADNSNARNQNWHVPG
jgi:glucarate dehydratase